MDGPLYTANHEGCRLSAYPDAGGYSIGRGHHSADIAADTIWTQTQCDSVYAVDYALAQGNAESCLDASIDDIRFAALADMAFELGYHGLLGFPKMLSALRLGLWQEAHDACLASKYAQEVPNRANDNATVFLTGNWP